MLFTRSLARRPGLFRSSNLALLFFLLPLLVHAQSSSEWPRLQTSEWTKTNFDKMSVDKSEILSGGPPRDGIPPIDKPAFVSVTEAAEWLGDDEPVIAFEQGGVARAYPLQIMMFHEIVNDVVGDLPVAVTFCPLCNASIVFERQLDGEILDFGTTGRLRKSDLIMYDRQTESWWQQFTGTAIIGDYLDTRLQQRPSQIIGFQTFATAYPNGEVLSRDTGFRRMYGQNPYAGYDSINSNPFLFQGKVDPRLPAMERVLSLPTGTGNLLIPLSSLESTPLVHLDAGDEPVVVLAQGKANTALGDQTIANARLIPAAAAFSRRVDGETLEFVVEDDVVRDTRTRSSWNALGQSVAGELKGARLQQIDGGVHFAFAWLAFDPDATIHSGN